MPRARFTCSIAAAIIAFTTADIRAQAPAAAAPLSLEDVIKLCQDGFSEEVVVAKIKKNNKPFDLSREELVELKKSGVNDTILRLLIDPSVAYAPPVPPPVAVAPTPPAPPPSAPPVAAPKPTLPAREYP